MSRARDVEREARRLVRCYPEAWRARYGDEFTQLLIDELTDGEVSLARRLDVFVHGVWTRLTYAGLAGSVLDSERRTRSMLAALVAVSAVFVMLGVGVWAQLTIGLAVVSTVERRNHRGHVVDVCWIVRFGCVGGLGHCAVCRPVAPSRTRGVASIVGRRCWCRWLPAPSCISGVVTSGLTGLERAGMPGREEVSCPGGWLE